MKFLKEIEDKLLKWVLIHMEVVDSQQRTIVMTHINQALQQAYDLGHKEALEVLEFVKPKTVIDFVYYRKDDDSGLIHGKIIDRSLMSMDIDVEVQGTVVYSTDSLEDAKAWVKTHVAEYYGKES